MSERVKGMFWVAAFAVIGGLILIFSSTSFGMARGESWGLWQTEYVGEYDAEMRQLIITTAVNKFLILGSLLLGSGLLLAILTYFYFLLTGQSEEAGIEAGQVDTTEEL